MQPFSQTVFMLLLNRLQSKPSVQFTQCFVYFFAFLCAVDNVGPDFVVSVLDGIQPGWVEAYCGTQLILFRLFGNLLTGVVLGNTQKAPIKSRKVIEVGLTALLTKSDGILVPTNTPLWSVASFL